MNEKLYQFSVTIQKPHLDQFGHMNNAVYLTLLEQARWAMVASNGCSMQDITASGLGPVILEIHISFLKEILLDDHIIIETQVPTYMGKICKINQSILRSKEVCCKAEFTIGTIDLNKRKLVLPTPVWLKALGLSD